jgi:hypothetical protein
MPDYLPKNDAAFIGWTQRFITGLTAHQAALGITTEIDTMDELENAFAGKVAEYGDRKTALKAALNGKKSSKASAADFIRPLVARLQLNEAMDDGIRGDLGIPVRGAHVSARGIGPEVPNIRVETEPGRVIVHFGTQPNNERLNKRPSWAHGCNIYRKVAGEEGFTLLAFQKTSPYTDVITGSAKDYTYYVAYRGNKAIEIGGQSVEATVAARGAQAA